jgi:hypothetical protein
MLHFYILLAKNFISFADVVSYRILVLELDTVVSGKLDRTEPY